MDMWWAACLCRITLGESAPHWPHIRKLSESGQWTQGGDKSVACAGKRTAVKLLPKPREWLYSSVVEVQMKDWWLKYTVFSFTYSRWLMLGPLPLVSQMDLYLLLIMAQFGGFVRACEWGGGALSTPLIISPMHQCSRSVLASNNKYSLSHSIHKLVITASCIVVLWVWKWYTIFPFCLSGWSSWGLLL